MMIKLIITGYCILFGAILANIVADYLNIYTWYKFIQEFLTNGLNKTLSSQSVFSLIWLFLIYPLILSGSSILGIKLYHFLIQ